LRLRSRGAGLRQDAYGSPLTFSGGDSDTLMLALLRATYSGRNDAALAASVEQALPVQPAWLNFNRLRLRAERSVPLGAGVSAQLCGKGAHPPPPRPSPPDRLQAVAAISGCISCTRSPALHFLHPVPRPLAAHPNAGMLGGHMAPGSRPARGGGAWASAGPPPAVGGGPQSGRRHLRRPAASNPTLILVLAYSSQPWYGS